MIFINIYFSIRIRRKNKNKIKIVLRLSVCVRLLQYSTILYGEDMFTPQFQLNILRVRRWHQYFVLSCILGDYRRVKTRKEKRGVGLAEDEKGVDIVFTCEGVRRKLYISVLKRNKIFHTRCYISVGGKRRFVRNP